MPPALPDLLGGRLNALWDAPGTVLLLICEGKLLVYGVSTAKRDPKFLDMPTMAEQGLPSFDFRAYLGIYAPAGTPKDVVKTLNDATGAAMSTEKMRTLYANTGSTPGSMTSDEFTESFRGHALSSVKPGNELGLIKE